MVQTARAFSNDHKFFLRESAEKKISIKINRLDIVRNIKTEEHSRSIASWLMASEIITGLGIPSIPSEESFQREHIVLRFSLSEKYQKEFSLLKGLFSFGKHHGINVQANSAEKFFTVSILPESEASSIEYFQQIFQWLEKEVKFRKVIREVVRFEQKVQQEQALLFSLLQN